MHLVAALWLSSCATPNNYRPVSQAISFPELNTQASAAIGDTMIAQGTSTLTRGIILREVNRIQTYELNPGFYPQTGEDENFTYHSYTVGNVGNGFGWLRVGGGLLGPGMNDVQSIRAAKSQQQLCAVRAIGVPFCDTEHSYDRTERAIVGENNFQQTLIYNGRVGNRIRIGYREFSGDIARPAFSNEVEYDLSDSMEINYRGARIRIVSANNQRIEYVLLSNFNTSSPR